jgi:iron-sulfur cluster repair protein YtfE (RIC family)
MKSRRIKPDMRVNEVIEAYPETIAVFDHWGVDSCCGGARPLSEVAERHGFDLPLLMEQLEGVVTVPPSPSA